MIAMFIVSSSEVSTKLQGINITVFREQLVLLSVRTWITLALYSSAFKSWGYARRRISKVTFHPSLCLGLSCSEFLVILERTRLEAFLAPWRNPDSEGHQRAAFGKDGFTIKWVGLFVIVVAFD